MQGFALRGLVKLLDLDHISDKDPLSAKIGAILKIIGRIYSRNLDSTIDLRYRLYYKALRSRKYAVYYLLKSLGLEELFNFLIDNNIEDIILIPNKYIYITDKYGKKITNIYTSSTVVERFLVFARAKGLKLLKTNPSFRYGLKLGPLRLRVSVDLPPVVSSPHVYIRIHRKTFTLEDLIRDGFIDEHEAEVILKEIVRGGKSLIVSGPPGSGKTTLLQAVDLEMPYWLQRVYIDEADEFLDLPHFNQIKISSINKIKEIFASMNRNIDLFIIGELQYPEHFQAYRVAQEIGLQALGTMHATSLEGARRRLEEVGISAKNLVIIQLNKIYSRNIIRKIKEIYVG
ncbi:MAG: ATPase, T2SS/T4P/T4SS family [Thermoproteus sp.]